MDGVKERQRSLCYVRIHDLKAFLATAANLIFLVGRGIAQYARFAETPGRSHLYFTDRLTDEKYTKGLVVTPDWMYFSIPTFVKRLTGDVSK